MFRVLFTNHVKLILQQSLFWGAAVLVVAFSIVLYYLYSVDHATTFWRGETSPPARYMMIYLGGIPLVIMMLVSCFLSIRTLAKDSHSRIEEVLLTKPFGNLIHALSATLASTLFCALPILGFTLVVYLVVGTQGWFNADVAESFEFVSVSVFLIFTTLVSLNFVSLLCYYVYSTVRVAILGVLGSVAIVILIIYLLTRVSFNQFVFFEFLPLVGDVASDMIGNKLDMFDYLRFLGYISLCTMLAVGATWLKSRRDEQGKLRILLFGFFGAITCVSFSVLLVSWFNQSSNVENWQRHVIAIKDDITLDLKTISGSVVVRPGRTMEADITIVGTSAVNVTPDDELVVWLNPGLKVQLVQVDNSELLFERDGEKLSLRLDQEIQSGENVELNIQYRGKPNTQYGYEDSTLDVANIPFWDQLISYFGMNASVFDRKYVALPHATHWLPTSTMQATLGAGSIDFVEADLTITIPIDWVITLTGNVTGQELDPTDERTRSHRFTSHSPIGGISLFTSDMTKHTTYLDTVDLTLELYISNRHQRSLQANHGYEKYLQVFKQWFIEKIEEARALGYSFSCKSYRFVAVPSNLRLYGGGTFMDSNISQPCTYSMREHGLIATKLKRISMSANYDNTRLYRMEIDMYFAKRHTGGDLELEFADHFFEFQIGFKGLKGEYIKTVLSYLHNLIWSDRPHPTPYSASVFFPRAMKVTRMSPKAEYIARMHTMQMDESMLQSVIKDEVTLKKTIIDYVKRYMRHIDQTDIVFNYFLEGDAVVNTAVQNSLQTLAHEEPHALTQEAIRLRCIAIAQKIFYTLGRAKSRQLLQNLTEKFQYQNISVSDVIDTAVTLDLPVKEILVGWFDKTEQFHFSFSPATVSKHLNPETEEIFYQIILAVSNTGTTTGVFRTLLRVDSGATEINPTESLEEDRTPRLAKLENAGYVWGPLILIPTGTTQDVGIITATRPYRVNLRSWDMSFVNEVSLIVHRDPLVVDGTEQVPFEGTRPSTWVPERVHGIVINDTDLPVQPRDDGVITYDKNFEMFDFGGAWGNSRKSFVYTENVKTAKVNMNSEIPTSDNWRIELHVPDIRGAQSIGHRQRRMMVAGRTYFKGKFAGEYEITIVNGDQEEKLKIEVFNRDYGWLSVGRAQLAAGSVDITIAPKPGTEQLFFDALRFVRLGEVSLPGVE